MQSLLQSSINTVIARLWSTRNKYFFEIIAQPSLLIESEETKDFKNNNAKEIKKGILHFSFSLALIFFVL